MRFFSLTLGLILCCAWLTLPVAVAEEQESDVSGLWVGEKDTTRLQYRLTGKDEKADNDRIRDQKQGREERGLQREMREEGENLLLAEEEARIDRARLRKEQEVAEKRRQLTEREFDRKKKVEFSFFPDE